MQAKELPKEEIQPEPPPLTENNNMWLDDVMPNATQQSIHSLKYCVEINYKPTHPFQDTDFSRIQQCQCTKNCTKHYTFKEPKPFETNTPV